MLSMSHDWSSRPSPGTKSALAPDTPSQTFPNRVIRPLPRRKLRDRLSTEQVEAIVFPTEPEEAPSIFSHPYSNGKAPINNLHEPFSLIFVPPRQSPLLQARTPAPKSLAVAAPYPEGEEVFENANNKKKRKNSQPQLNTTSAFFTSELGDVHTAGVAVGPLPYSSTSPCLSGSSNSGFTSSIIPVRYRMLDSTARGTSDRTPLATSTNAINVGVSFQPRLSPSKSNPYQSTALDNLNKSTEYNPITGERCVPLLSLATALADRMKEKEREAQMARDKAQKTQEEIESSSFTFTCDPPSDRLIWPGQQTMASSTTDKNSNGSIAAPPKQSSNPKANNAVASPASQSQTSSEIPSQQLPPKTRPVPVRKVYEYNAKQRKMKQEYSNQVQPPRREDLWICEFCEYEAVFGQAPRALVRRYEAKALQNHEAQAERRKFLDKAKKQSRKGKKSALVAPKQPPARFAQQAAEFQKNEMLRATQKLESHKQQLQQAHQEMKACNAQASSYPQVPSEVFYDDEEDDDEDCEYELDYEDDGEDDEGDTDDAVDSYYAEEPPRTKVHPPPLSQFQVAAAQH